MLLIRLVSSHINKCVIFAAFAISLIANADSEITIRKDQTGHFRVMGAINGVPTYFLVDTGATITSVPLNVANQSGLTRQHCRPIASNTANGISRGCSYKGQLSLGPINVECEIQVLPNLTMSLLGMNALNGLNIHQSDQLLTLTKGDPIPSSISITPSRSEVVGVDLGVTQKVIKRGSSIGNDFR